MAHFQVQQDIVIIGGGVAGLWLHNIINKAGFTSILLEQNALGAGQTIASQGMLHGGIKYSLQGQLSHATSTIADMPKHWQACLDGHGEIDLSNCETLSEHYYMWSTESLLLQLTSFLGSKALRGQISQVPYSERPKIFSSDTFKGQLYRISDRVLDVPSLLHALKKPFEDRIFHVPHPETKLDIMPGGEASVNLVIHTHSDQINIAAQYLILTAGLGNELLIEQSDLTSSIKTQRRPLHMVMACHRSADSLYGHCVGASTVPKMTITTHPMDDGRYVWYIGGAVAETGVNRTEHQQIEHAKQQLNKLLPWVELDQAQWHSFFIDRAEPEQPGLTRPDASCFSEKNHIIAAWPTKLTLTPQLGQRILEYLHGVSMRPQYNLLPDLPLLSPRVALTPWQEAF